MIIDTTHELLDTHKTLYRVIRHNGVEVSREPLAVFTDPVLGQQVYASMPNDTEEVPDP